MGTKYEKIGNTSTCPIPECHSRHLPGSVFCAVHHTQPLNRAGDWRRQCADGLAVASTLFRQNGHHDKADMVLEGARTIAYAATRRNWDGLG